ncbi:RNA-directed DNA polymerase, eukaryota, reverse transcriptase zinc-binding domain protein [Tanacetum coccineum]
MAWVKWENVLASFDKGGLEIGSLKAFNLALLQKWRWRYVNSPDSLWARVVKVIHGAETVFDLKGCSCNGVWSSIISSYAKLHDQNIIPENTLCHNVGDGSSILFWKDNWNGNGPLMLRFNRLYHLDVNKDCRLSDRRVHDAWVWNWNRPIIGSRNEAALALLVSELGHVIFSDRPDSWRWNMENDGIFTVHETRSHIDACMLPSISPCTAWLKVLPRKVNVFIWRFILDRLPTRLNLSLRGIEIPSIECPICNSGMESIDHIFFDCEVASNIWRMVRVWTNIDMPSFSSWFDWSHWFEDWRASKSDKDRVHCRKACPAKNIRI